MPDSLKPRGIALQVQLSNFLYGEMLHTLGSYGLSCQRFGDLVGHLEEKWPQEKEKEAEKERSVEEEEEWALVDQLRESAAESLECNEHLRDDLQRPGTEGRLPPPNSRQGGWDGPERDLLEGISSFYVDAAAALMVRRQDTNGELKQDGYPGAALGDCFAFIQDPHRRGGEEETDELIRDREERLWARLDSLDEFLPEESQKPPRPTLAEVRGDEWGKRFDRILDGRLGDERPLLPMILRAMSGAHECMHEAEYLRAKSFGPMFTTIPDTHARVQQMLRYSLVLNTFVFVAARGVPWIFAEDQNERRHVIKEYRECCDGLAPTYCMWTSAQFGLMALHRRAFTHWTMGKHDRAYRDFYKLNRLLKALRKPAEKRALRVPGTKTFIEGMTGMSELHIGRIYRGQHAHRLAVRYFERASHHLKGWEDHGEIGPMVRNSHWRLNLLINRGKAYYELGRVKQSLLSYAEAWRAFLLLVASETHASANVDVAEKFVEWLKPIVDEAELSRSELRPRLEPLVDQFVTLRSPLHLRLLAADIVMRMGHLLFLLRLPAVGAAEQKRTAPPELDHELASRCIEQAAFLDPSSTLIAADMLKIRHQTEPDVKLEKPPELPLADQWPYGSGRFEEAARITEYALQRWLAVTAPGTGEEPPVGRRKVARRLLNSFLVHTDSSNVKLAQVYRYLMREEREDEPEADSSEPTLDFVCLRRYSSFFPFLPRPSAFRAPGGGYFTQVREPGRVPFGIAIDPGPDFIENLYRCGYSLADIHMIVLTHDHADHIASLDALLALMGIRKRLGGTPFSRGKGHCLAIVGNKSVFERYSFFNEEHPVMRVSEDRNWDGTGDPDAKAARLDAVRVLCFEKLDEITRLDGPARSAALKAEALLPLPPGLRIEPVRTRGHMDAHGYISQGFLLRLAPPADGASTADEGASILFTGDTGAPASLSDPDWNEEAEDAEGADDHLLAKGSKSLRRAVEEADVVVAHLSSVPMRELRELAGLDSDSESEQGEIAAYKKLWGEAVEEAGRKGKTDDEKRGIEQTQFLLNQLQFGFRSLPSDGDDGLAVSPFSDLDKIKRQPDRHLFLIGLLDLVQRMVAGERRHPPLLLIGELREELGTFRTRIASRIAEAYFEGEGEGDERKASALTTDIGLRVRLSAREGGEVAKTTVLCTTCDLDNDLIPVERFHEPEQIREVCVKGEDEGVFYNCMVHDPRLQEDYLFLESVERYDVFGE